jgi:tetratricopeptide (TPR) repeat protein
VRLLGVELIRGNAELSARHAGRAEALAAKHGFRDVSLRLAFNRGVNLLLLGDFAGAEESLRQYRAAAAEAGSVQHQITALRYLGYTLLHAMGYAECAHAVDQALELSETSGESWNRVELLALRARAALELGDLEMAQLLIDRALASLRDDDITAVSEAQNHLGLIRAAEGRVPEAEVALRHSLEVVAYTEYNSIKATVAFDLAGFLAEQARFDEATTLCDEYVSLTERWGWRQWTSQVARIRRRIAAGQHA